MPILFYTINYKHKYFVFSEQNAKSKAKGVQIEYLDQDFEISDEQDEDSFKAYLTEVSGSFSDDSAPFQGDDARPAAELRPFMLIYLPSSAPALFAIDEKSHDGLVRLNISHYEKYMPQVETIFNHRIAKEDLPDLSLHQIPAEWLEPQSVELEPEVVPVQELPAPELVDQTPVSQVPVSQESPVQERPSQEFSQNPFSQELPGHEPPDQERPRLDPLV